MIASTFYLNLPLFENENIEITLRRQASKSNFLLFEF